MAFSWQLISNVYIENTLVKSSFISFFLYQEKIYFSSSRGYYFCLPFNPINFIKLNAKSINRTF